LEGAQTINTVLNQPTNQTAIKENSATVAKEGQAVEIKTATLPAGQTDISSSQTDSLVGTPEISQVVLPVVPSNSTDTYIVPS
jgi:hypothetical protein